ncbi:MAG: MFS transporter [Ktedonobacterales bacterium]
MAEASLVRRLSGGRSWKSYLKPYLGYQRNVYLLLLFTLGKGFQLGIAAVSVNLYVNSIFHDTDFVGIVAAMPAVGALAAGVPIGFLADRMGRKPLLLISGLLNPLALAAIGLSTSAPLLVIASLCNGFLSSAYWVTNLPMLTESSTEEQRVGVLALNNFLLLGVGALGALIGGAVPEFVGSLVHQPADHTLPLRWGVLAASIVVFLSALPLFWLKESQTRKAAAEGAAAAQEVHAEALPVEVASGASAPAYVAVQPAVETPPDRGAVRLLFMKLLIPDLLFTTGEGAVVALLPVFFNLHFGVGVGVLGVLITVAGLIGGATSLSAPYIERRWGRLRMATTMQYLSAPFMLVIGLSPVFPLAAAAEFGRQILRGLFEPVYAAFAMGRVSARNRATLSGFYSLTWSLGFSIGPISAGFLLKHVGSSTAFMLGAACLVASATLLRVFFPKE